MQRRSAWRVYSNATDGVDRMTKNANRAGVRESGGDKDVHGEGNYSAARRFGKDETEFVEHNKDQIPALGKQAEKALEGKEGKALRDAEDRARSHSHARGKDDK
jgi:hypothetical protein